MGIRAIVYKRITRIEAANFGDAKTIKGSRGIYELRIHHSPGYRIYFGKKGNLVVVLLCGGDKSKQSQDIARAQQYWKDYKENN